MKKRLLKKSSAASFVYAYYLAFASPRSTMPRPQSTVTSSPLVKADVSAPMIAGMPRLRAVIADSLVRPASSEIIAPARLM